MTDSLATKQDLRELELRMDARFVQLDVHFDARLADLERRMTMRLGGMIVPSIGVFSALVKLL